jgi:hypothetical protein
VLQHNYARTCIMQDQANRHKTFLKYISSLLFILFNFFNFFLVSTRISIFDSWMKFLIKKYLSSTLHVLTQLKEGAMKWKWNIILGFFILQGRKDKARHIFLQYKGHPLKYRW